VVVAVGLRTTDPLADVDADVPGVMATLVAPEATQLSVVLLPAMTAAGLAVKEVIVGAATSLVVGNLSVQPVRPVNAGRRNSAQTMIREVLFRWTSDCNA
jgi:hypothetical protein